MRKKGRVLNLPPEKTQEGGESLATSNQPLDKKRQLIKKKKRNKAKRRLVTFLFVFLCTGVIFTVLKAPFFNVETIICVGQQELSEEKIIEIAGAKKGVNVFTMSVKDMKSKLSDNPLIAECNVRRLFPDKIKIWVRESQPVAYAESGGLLVVTDKNGRIIKTLDSTKKDEMTGVIRLEGFVPAEMVAGGYINNHKDAVHNKTYECIEILDKLGMIQKVTKLSAGDLSDIMLDYEDRLHIKLGDYEKMEYKLTFVKKVISDNLSDYEKAILDYRGDTLYVEPMTEDVLGEAKTDEEITEEETAQNGSEPAQNPENANQDEKQQDVTVVREDTNTQEGEE